MRYFICPSAQQPRFCTIEVAAPGNDIVWIVFDFKEDKNSIFVKLLHKNFVRGFIERLAVRTPRFNEVEEAIFTRELQSTRSRSEVLEEQGVPIKWLFDDGLNQYSNSLHADDLPESSRRQAESTLQSGEG